jgi:O-antigen/teichoic acid export membrane protein
MFAAPYASHATVMRFVPPRNESCRLRRVGLARGDPALETSPVTAKQTESKNLGKSALVYLIPNLLVRGASFLLTPLYAWTMGPADFAVIGISTTIIGLLAAALGFALFGSVTRMHFECEDEAARKKYYGTILLFLGTVPVALTVLLEVLGRLGLLEVFQTVSFRPHLEIVIWTALLSIYPNLATALFMAREEPSKVAGLNMLTASLQIGLNLFLVLGLQQGALGVLRGGLASAAVTAVVSLVAMRKHISFGLNLVLLKHSLAFSLPLIPHLLGNWALSVSDRLILDYLHVAADAIGIYSLAYYFSFGVSMVGGAVTSALSPIANRLLKADPQHPEVPVLGGYALLVIVFVGLGSVLFAPEALEIMTPTPYHAAAPLVPWVVLGALFQGMYLINSIGTWFSMRTRAVPVVTAVTALASVGINFALVPRMGTMAAAISTAVSYGLAAVLHGFLADRLHRIAWGYARWGRMLGCGVLCAAIGEAVPAVSPWLTVPFKALLLAGLFPGLLVATRVLTAAQLFAILQEVPRIVRARLQRAQ